MRASRQILSLHVQCAAVSRNYFWRLVLANIRSAIKRNRQNKKRREHNRVFRGQARTYIKQVDEAINAGDSKQAEASVTLAISALDRAASKGIIHKNNAARRKSAVMRKLTAMKK